MMLADKVQNTKEREIHYLSKRKKWNIVLLQIDCYSFECDAIKKDEKKKKKTRKEKRKRGSYIY